MSIFTTAQAKRVDRSNPELERLAIFQNLKDAPCIFYKDMSATAFSAAAVAVFTAPYAMRIADVIVNAQATEGSGTVKVMKGTDEICTAIACASDGAVTHMSAGAVVANKARLVLAAGDTINIQAAGGTAANIRGIVTVIGARV